MDTGKSALGLDGNLAAALGYPVGIIAIICLIMEKENRFVKFHALQSILLHVAFIVVAIVVWILGFILLPWTTLAYAVMWDVGTHEVRGFEWFIVIVAFLADLGAHGGSARRRKD